MLHLALHARPFTWLVRDHYEMVALWERLAGLGQVHAMVIMPDHAHVLLPRLEYPELLGAKSGFARWRNRRRGDPGGPVWVVSDAPAVLKNREHYERTRRYLHLNPCRARLVADPLAWAFSTHRDRVDLSIPSVCSAESDPHAFHAYVSGDATVDVAGTELPTADRGFCRADLNQVEQAVSALCRTPIDLIRRRGMVRDLLIRSVQVLLGLKPIAVARALGISKDMVLRTPHVPAEQIDKVERVLGDRRFPSLGVHPLVGTSAWRNYQRQRNGKHLALARRLGLPEAANSLYSAWR